MTYEKALDRVVKLLALAKGTDSPNEAASAAAKAAEIMRQFEIDETEIEIREKRTGEATERSANRLAPSRWIVPLGNIVARVNFCKLVYSTYRRNITVTFIGRSTSAVTAMEMFEWLVREIKHLSAQAWADAKDETFTHARTWKLSYEAGVVDEIWHRLDDEFRAQIEKANEKTVEIETPETGSALMVLGDALIQTRKAEIDEFIAKRYGRLRTGRSSAPARTDNRAYRAGAARGRSMDLSGRGRIA